MSRLDLLAGPNGAGKTTFFDRVISPGRPGLPFVNADHIAADRFPGAESERSYEAAEIAATARDALIDARLDFCTETVFSHSSKVDLVTTAFAAGYDIVMHIIMVPLDLALHRVASRVAAGGHDVPAEKVELRYARLWANVVDALPHCCLATFHDNSHDSGPAEVAAFRHGLADHPPRWPRWTPEVLVAATGIA